jgi:hypothetical protein
MPDSDECLFDLEEKKRERERKREFTCEVRFESEVRDLIVK